MQMKVAMPVYREVDFSSLAVCNRAQKILAIGKAQGWQKLEMLSALGKLAASILASMENPREALIAWEECVEEEMANVLKIEQKNNTALYPSLALIRNFDDCKLIIRSAPGRASRRVRHPQVRRKPHPPDVTEIKIVSMACI